VSSAVVGLNLQSSFATEMLTVSSSTGTRFHVTSASQAMFTTQRASLSGVSEIDSDWFALAVDVNGILGQDHGLTVDGVNQELYTQQLAVGTRIGNEGVVDFAGSNNDWEIFTLLLGGAGSGRMLVRDGAQMSGGSLFVRAGTDTSGILSVSGGAKIDAFRIGIDDHDEFGPPAVGTPGNLLVSGVGSAVRVQEDLHIGPIFRDFRPNRDEYVGPGNGTINVSSAGSLTAKNAFVGRGGSVTVDNNGEMRTDRDLYLNGKLSVGQNGRVTIGELSPTSNFARITLGGQGSEIDVNGGSLIVGNDFPVNGEIRLAGALKMSGGTVRASVVRTRRAGFLPGSVDGFGEVDANVVNEGSFGIQGRMHVTGDYVQGSDGQSGIIVDPSLKPANGQTALIIDGSASLAGTLTVTRSNQFIPQVGDRFQLMRYGSLNGRFSRFEGAAINDDRYFALEYYDDHLDLLVLSATTGLAGDLNSDGTVDAADYVAWRERLGTQYTAVDYDVWRMNFGRSTVGASGASPAGTTPEPSILSQVMVLAFLAAARRRTNLRLRTRAAPADLLDD
jgi:hypothetical protein